MKSIQSRLITGLVLSLVSIFTLLWFLVNFSIQQLAENYTASRLEHDIETLLTAVNFDVASPELSTYEQATSEEATSKQVISKPVTSKPVISKPITSKQAILKLKQERINPIYHRPFSGHYYVIKHNNNLIRSRSLWDQALNINSTIGTTYTQSKQMGPKEQPLLLVSRQFSKQGEILTISVAEDLSTIIKGINELKQALAVAAVIALLFLVLLQTMILRLGFRPLRNIKHEINDLKQGRIKELNQPQFKELKPLTLEVNHLLSILNQRINRSRNAISDLSHAMKKPLTILAQLTTDDIAHQPDKSGQIVNHQVRNIQQLTDSILKRARLSGTNHSGVLFDFKEDLDALIQTIKMMYPQKKIEVQIRLTGDIEKQFDREDMLELIGNLLDNAYKWANQTINITISRTQTWIISIEDDGVGCNLDALNDLSRRGTRLDESVEGHGLGLSIVEDIVKEYYGNMILKKSESLGGFMVKITIPTTKN